MKFKMRTLKNYSRQNLNKYPKFKSIKKKSKVKISTHPHPVFKLKTLKR